VVVKGLECLFNQASVVNLTSQTCIGDPEADDGDSDADGIGIAFERPLMYEGSIAVLALVNSASLATAQTYTALAGVVAGQTLYDIAVDAKDYLAWAQTDLTNTAPPPVTYMYCGQPVLWGQAEGFTSDGATWQFRGYAYIYPYLCSVEPGGWTVNYGDGAPEDPVIGECPWWGDDYYSAFGYGGAAATSAAAPSGLRRSPPTARDSVVFNRAATAAGPVALGSGPEQVAKEIENQRLRSLRYQQKAGNLAQSSGLHVLAAGIPGEPLSHTYSAPGIYTVTVNFDLPELWTGFFCSMEVTVPEPPENACQGNGWRYYENYWDIDNSVSQWPALALLEAERRWEIGINPKVKSEFAKWLAVSQEESGTFIYAGVPWSMDWPWPNFAKAGAGLIMLDWVGQDSSSEAAQKALAYLGNTYNEVGGDYGNKGNLYAMYAFYKGMKLYELTTLEVPPGSGTQLLWEPDYQEYLVGSQQPDNQWYPTAWMSPTFTTYVALAILAPEVAGLPPVAEADGPYGPVNPGQAVTFNGSQSRHLDPNHQIVKYQWDYNAADGLWWNTTKPAPAPDEGALNAVNPTLAAGYPDTGEEEQYTVTLRVIDDSDPPLTDTDTSTVTVETGNVPPVAVTNGPWASVPNSPVTFDGRGSYDPNACTDPGRPECLGDEITRYEWDLDGDGQFDEANGDDGTAVTENRSIVTKTYTALATGLAALRVTDQYGQTNTSSAQFVVISIVFARNYEDCWMIRNPYNVQRLDPRFRIVRTGKRVTFRNEPSSAAAAENVGVTLTSVPTNLTIISGVSSLGDMGIGESKQTACDPVAKTADIVTETNPAIGPTGDWSWKATFRYNNQDYTILNIPPMGP
jgi:hypothetical protein